MQTLAYTALLPGPDNSAVVTHPLNPASGPMGEIGAQLGFATVCVLPSSMTTKCEVRALSTMLCCFDVRSWILVVQTATNSSAFSRGELSLERLFVVVRAVTLPSEAVHPHLVRCVSI